MIILVARKFLAMRNITLYSVNAATLQLKPFTKNTQKIAVDNLDFWKGNKAR